MADIKKEGNKYMEQIMRTNETFRQNSAARGAVGQHIADLGARIDGIKTYVKDIESISMQVKILSLNASEKPPGQVRPERVLRLLRKKSASCHKIQIEL